VSTNQAEKLRQGVSEEKVWDILISWVWTLPSSSHTSYTTATLKTSCICFHRNDHNPGILKCEEVLYTHTNPVK